MAGMTTVLTEFADNGNTRTYTLSGHLATKPKLVIQKRRVADGNKVVSETDISVILATEDAAGVLLPSKVAFTASIRYPITGDSADVTSALAVFRDIVAGDEFGAVVTTQNWLS